MLETILRRSVRLARFATPDPLTAWRVWRLRRGGDFDRAFYRRVHPGLHPIYRAFPERHFVVFGERAGLLPSPATAPGGGPAGAPGRRMPVLRPTEAPPGSDVAAVVHLYYPELWPEIRDALRGCGLAPDLLVTIAERGAGSRELAAQVARDWPGARVWRLPNRGRDVLPFVHLVNSGLLEPYRAVCKLHTKRSRHLEGGDAWRSELIAGLLQPGRARAQLDAFLADGDAAFWIADGQAYAEPRWWGVNEPRVRALLRRIEVPVERRALRFPAGSMYWVKPLTLRMIRGLRLRAEEFELEERQLDGTMAHAVERAMGFVASAAGQTIRETSELDAAAARGAGAPRRSNGANPARAGRVGRARTARPVRRAIARRGSLRCGTVARLGLLPAAVPPHAGERPLVGPGLHRMDRGLARPPALRGPRPAEPARRSGLLRPARHGGHG